MSWITLQLTSPFNIDKMSQITLQLTSPFNIDKMLQITLQVIITKHYFKHDVNLVIIIEFFLNYNLFYTYQKLLKKRKGEKKKKNLKCMLNIELICHFWKLAMFGFKNLFFFQKHNVN